MPISGLLITLDSDEAMAEQAVASMRRDQRVEVGDRIGSRLPVVLETAGPDDDRAFIEGLRSLGGVRFVEVAYIHFDGARGPDDGPREI